MFLLIGRFFSVLWFLFFCPHPKFSAISIISSCFQLFLVASLALIFRSFIFSPFFLNFTLCFLTLCLASPPMIYPLGTLKQRCLKTICPPSASSHVSMNGTIHSVSQARNLGHLLTCVSSSTLQQCEEKKWGEIETKSFGGKSFSETKSTNRSREVLGGERR